MNETTLERFAAGDPVAFGESVQLPVASCELPGRWEWQLATGNRQLV